MSGRAIAVAVLVVALMATCGLSILVAFTAVSFMSSEMTSGDSIVNLFSRADTVAEVVESARVSVGRDPALDVDSDSGDVSVKAGNVRSIQIEMTKRAWGSNEEEATAAAEALDVVVDHVGDTVSVTYRQPTHVDVVSSRGGSDGVSLVITVPLKTDVRLLTGFGDLALRGTRGEASLTSSFGDVEADDVTGSVTAESESGSITLTDVDAGSADVEATTSFGNVTLEAVDAHSLTLRSQNGDLAARKVALKEALAVETSFGDVQLTNVSAETLEVEAQNGDIDLESVSVEALATLDSGFGEVDLQQVEAATLTVTTGGGGMNLESVRGDLDLESGFGDIEVRAKGTTALDAENQHGAIRFAGTLDEESTHTVRSEFGDVSLELPEDSNFDVHLESGFGTIQSDLPITVAGEMDESMLRGRLGDGGQLLKVTTQSGNIELRVLQRSLAR